MLIPATTPLESLASPAPTSARVARRNLLLISAAFVLSRIIYIAYLGVRFYTDSLKNYLQFIDPKLLRDDLLRNLWYFHSQPPLFNLFLGVILKLFPTSYPYAFQTVFLFLGLAFVLLLYLLMIKIGVHRNIALTLSILFSISPTTILHENWLFYSYPIAVLLCAAAYCFACFLETWKARWGMLFFLSLVLASFMHAMFGHIFLFILISSLLIFLPKRRRLILRCAAFPVALVVLLAIKQFVLFGSITPGASYIGPNLACRLMLMTKIPENVRAELIKSGDVPPYFFIYPVRPINQFNKFRTPSPPTGIPVLDDELKSTGYLNFNHRDFITLNNGYMQGVWAVFKKNPGYFLDAYRDTWPYFNPGAQGLEETQMQSDAITNLQHNVDLIVGGQPIPSGPCIFLIIMFPALLVFGVVKIVNTWRTRAANPQPLLIAYLLFMIAFVSAVTMSVTWGDWFRYRFGVDAFYLTLFGLMLTTVQKKLRHIKLEL